MPVSRAGKKGVTLVHKLLATENENAVGILQIEIGIGIEIEMLLGREKRSPRWRRGL